MVDLALLARGFHVVAAPVVPRNPVRSGKQWDAVYKRLTDLGFSRKPVLEGAGTVAGEAYAWAIANPYKVSCIYGENPSLHSPHGERHRRLITWPGWPRPAYRSFTFVGALTRGSMTSSARR